MGMVRHNYLRRLDEDPLAEASLPARIYYVRLIIICALRETDPTIEQVYNGFCRGGNDCNHHSSLGKWKFGSPALPLFNTVVSFRNVSLP